MSEGFRNYESTGSMQPLIPRAHPSLPTCSPDLQNQATVTHIFETYVRLLRENNILSNQVKLINSEKESLG